MCKKKARRRSTQGRRTTTEGNMESPKSPDMQHGHGPASDLPPANRSRTRGHDESMSQPVDVATHELNDHIAWVPAPARRLQRSRPARPPFSAATAHSCTSARPRTPTTCQSNATRRLLEVRHHGLALRKYVKKAPLTLAAGYLHRRR